MIAWIVENEETGELQILSISESPKNSLSAALVEDEIITLSWTKSVKILVMGKNRLLELTPAGNFLAADIPLLGGENRIGALSIDDTGNVGPLSDEIRVTAPSVQLPDLSVHPDDITLFPSSPVREEIVGITVWLRNGGSIVSHPFKAEIWIRDENDTDHLIESADISGLEPGDTTTINALWETAEYPGNNRLTVVLDPGEKIKELSEANNHTSKTVYVSSLLSG